MRLSPDSQVPIICDPADEVYSAHMVSSMVDGTGGIGIMVQAMTINGTDRKVALTQNWSITGLHKAVYHAWNGDCWDCVDVDSDVVWSELIDRAMAWVQEG